MSPPCHLLQGFVLFCFGIRAYAKSTGLAKKNAVVEPVETTIYSVAVISTSSMTATKRTYWTAPLAFARILASNIPLNYAHGFCLINVSFRS